MQTNLDEIKFNYPVEDFNLFDDDQKRFITDIENYYTELQKYCVSKVEIIVEGTEKEWITSRINAQVVTLIMSLLYLTESFRSEALNFNLVASAATVKSMVEIPIHLGYLLWVLTEYNDFETIKEKIHSLGFGQIDKKTGLVHVTNVKQRTMYEKSDLMFKKLSPETPDFINIFETIYKESNASGHNNYSIRNILCGNQSGTSPRIWEAKDRKEWFLFITSKIFQVFLHVSTILFTTSIFLKAINHRLDQLPDYLSEDK